MLTNKAKYGLRAMCAHAVAEEEWAQSQAIAARADVPRKFLESILVELRHAGFVCSSIRGKLGRQRARPARRTDPRRRLDSRHRWSPRPVCCASITAYAPCADCRDPERCAVRCLMREVRAALSSVLDTYTLQALAERAEHDPLLHPGAPE